MDNYYKIIADNASFDIDKITNKHFAITGATGYIGSNLINFLTYLNRTNNLNIRITAYCTDLKKAQAILQPSSHLELIVCKNEDFSSNIIPANIDYFIHTASPTKSKFFVENPVETIDASVIGISKILSSLKNHQLSRFIYLSSMEAYGDFNSVAAENNLGYIDLSNPRSSYPEGKRISELYCNAYATEYNIPISICRLAMCFGPGILPTENRAYMSFIKQAKSQNKITLQSSGESSLNFISILDALSAIIFIATSENTIGTFNLCCDYENASIRTLAEHIGAYYGVPVAVLNEKSTIFANDNKMVLSNEKIKNIGYKQIFNLEQTINSLIKYVEENENI